MSTGLVDIHEVKRFQSHLLAVIENKRLVSPFEVKFDRLKVDLQKRRFYAETLVNSFLEIIKLKNFKTRINCRI